MARNLYEKLMNKYEANPEDPMAKFTKSRPKNSVKDTNSTLARMKEALSKGIVVLWEYFSSYVLRSKLKSHKNYIYSTLISFHR